MLDKRERVEQLRRLGFNVPRMLRIPAGTVLDQSWFRRMEAVRRGDERVTVRSYHPTDELHQTDLPRMLGGEVPEALDLVQRLVPLYHVLWQEWIPVKGTLYCGNIMLERDGGGYIEGARGEYEVRAVTGLKVPEEHRVTIRVTFATVLEDQDLGRLLGEARRAARLLRLTTGVVIEFNIQNTPVGEAGDRLIFWEWRPMVMRRKPNRRRRFPVLREFSEILAIGGPQRTDTDDRGLVGAVGNKAAQLLQMAALGMKVPPGFVIPITLCLEIARSGQIPAAVRAAFQNLRARTANTVDHRLPSLWSVRSSPTVSLPGLLHTVLNVGIDAESLTRMMTLPLETQRSIVSEYVLSYANAKHVISEQEVERVLSDSSVAHQTMHGRLSAWRDILREYGLALPLLADEQIDSAILAVIRSAAEVFSAHTNMEGAATAVIVQQMVFGNTNENSGTGVMHSRNPLVPSSDPVVEFVPVAQGPELVSGRRNPVDRIDLPGGDRLFSELVTAARKLESAFRDMQEIEFTIQSGDLWLLQSRRGERSAASGVQIAHALCAEGVIDEGSSDAMLADIDIRELLPEVASTEDSPIARGRSASAGAAIGRLATISAFAEGSNQILFTRRVDDAPHLMERVSGIVSLQGGTTSHGAVLARSYEVPVIVSLESGEVTDEGFRIGDHLVRAGEWVTIDGTRGLVFLGVHDIVRSEASDLDKGLMDWFLSRHRVSGSHRQRLLEWD